MIRPDFNALARADAHRPDPVDPLGRQGPNEVIVEKDGDVFVARSLTPDVASDGATKEEALANLKEALDLYYQEDSEGIT